MININLSFSLRKENTEIILAPFLMACSSTSQTNTTIALDCLGKMISFNYLPTIEPSRNLEATVNTDQTTSTDGNNKDRTPIERVVMAICACFVGEYTDDRIQTQVIKVNHIY
jgi:brefeldin A-inhibited guanine nucleotide-exchange protein